LDFETALRVNSEVQAVDQPAIAALVHEVAHRDFDPFTIGDVIIFRLAGLWCWLARHGRCLPIDSDSGADLHPIEEWIPSRMSSRVPAKSMGARVAAKRKLKN